VAFLTESAIHLQRLVPGAAMVGSEAAILYADHVNLAITTMWSPT
jgi:hypothetical protein